LFIGLLPTFPENFMQICLEQFLRKVANRHTDRQTNNDENMTSLVEATMCDSVLHRKSTWGVRPNVGNNELSG